MLTFRLGFVSLMSLVGTRVVLSALGADGYGTYCAVASLVWSVAFLNSSVSDCTTRFITYSLGKWDAERCREIFSTTFWLHCIAALFVVVVAETIGIWLLDNKLSLPEGTLGEVHIVFQLILASLVVGFVRQPYTALVLAHEKFRFYGCMEMADAALNLLLVLSLTKCGSEKLVSYTAILLALNIIVAGIYVGYSMVRYKESRIALECDLCEMKKMLVFCGCGVYGNMCVAARDHGNPLVLNMFFGVTANASASVAVTLSGVLAGIASSGIYQAYAPRITKEYASGNLSAMGTHLCEAVKFTVYAFCIFLVPTIIYMSDILDIWLVEVPPETVAFSRIALLTALLSAVIGITNMAIHATGDIRRLSFINGSMYPMCPLLSWVTFKYGGGETAMFFIELIMTALILANGCWIIKTQIVGLDSRRYMHTICGSLAVAAMLLLSFWLCLKCFE